MGFALGSLAGSALFPTQLPSGPRIQDTRTTTSAVGGPVPIVFGTCNVAGTVIWLAPYVEHSSNQSQKGGPQQQTFSYTQSIAIGLAERVDDEAADEVGAIGGLSRVWENGAIVYDIRPQQLASSELNTLAETDQEYANRLAASAAYAETFTLYLGDELQLPDPTIEAVLGAGNVPAFRALAYIVFPNRNLTIAQGLRHPNFQFEVYETGVGGCVTETLYSPGVLYPWAGGSIHDPTVSQNVNTFHPMTFDNNLLTSEGDGYLSYQYFNTYFTTIDDLLATLGPYYKTPLQYIGYSSAYGQSYSGPFSFEVQQTSGLFSAVPTPSDYISTQLNTVAIYYNWSQPLNGFYTDYQRFNSLIPVAYPTQIAGASYHTGIIGTNGDLILNTSVSALDPAPVLPPPWSTLSSTSYWFFRLSDVAILVTRSPAPPDNPCKGLLPSAIPGYSFTLAGNLVKCQPWTLVPGPYDAWRCLQKYKVSGGTNCYPWGPALNSTDPNWDNETFWTNAYNALVGASKMVPGLVYGVDYPVTPSEVYRLDNVTCVGGGSTATIAHIIAAVCARSGLTAIDVSDMESVSINGYPIATVCSGSAILTPLRSIGFFDTAESEGALKFVARGKPIVATLTTDDFGAYDASQSADPATCPPSITTARSQDEELPRSIRLHYMATSRDYQDAEQDSDFRETKATNDVDVTLPLCLDDTQAKRSAEVLWAAAWASRNAHNLSVDQAWLGLDLADCIGVPVDGVIQRLRLVSDSLASGILRKLACVRDGEGAYISFAVASAPQYVPPRLTFVGATSYELLDLPCLQDADSDPGFYVAAQRSGGGSWKGATFYKSIDGGATFTALFSLLQETVSGTIATAIPASEPYTWDDETVIIVNLPSTSLSFESVTDDAVLAGANAAAMGADRRWEIVQFAHAAQITPTQWALSRLLRGRRGTEHVLGTSRTGDAFVLVSAHTLGRVALQASEIGTLRTYRGTSIGATFSSGLDQAFAGHAEALRCFSPVDLAAEELTDGDIRISWLRRSRIGRTLMSGVDIPLGEATEAFQVDILSPDSPSSPEVVLRTLTVTTTQALYTAAEQFADFGTGPLTSIKVAIYQISAITGRGTPAVEILAVT